MPTTTAPQITLEYGYRDSKVQTGFSNTASTLKEIYKVADTHYWAPVSRITVQQRFEILSSTWQRDTSLNSFSFDITTHSAYLQIIGMGKVALPYIFDRLQKQPDHWFSALQAITGINAVKKENRGDLIAMTQDWLEWGVNNGYVDNQSAARPA